MSRTRVIGAAGAMAFVVLMTMAIGQCRDGHQGKGAAERKGECFHGGSPLR